MKYIISIVALVLVSSVAFAQVDETAIKNVNAFDSGPTEFLGTGTTYDGTNVGGVSFDRALSSCTSISGLGPVLGDVQPFTVDTDGPYDFSSTQDYDGYIHIYEIEFDPTDALLNCVIGDDDGPGGIGTSEVLGVDLQAGVQYFAVTSAFEAGDEGTFTNTIGGVGTVTLGEGDGEPLPPPPAVPTMSTWGMIAMALVLLVLGSFIMRRRSD